MNEFQIQWMLHCKSTHSAIRMQPYMYTEGGHKVGRYLH